MSKGTKLYTPRWRPQPSLISRRRQMDGSISLREVVETATLGTRRRLTAIEKRLKRLDGVTAELERLASIIAELERSPLSAAGNRDDHAHDDHPRARLGL